MRKAMVWSKANKLRLVWDLVLQICKPVSSVPRHGEPPNISALSNSKADSLGPHICPKYILCMGVKDHLCAPTEC